MALTPEGTPYVESTDLVANYPAASLSLANRVDLVGVLPFADSAARATAIPSPTDGQYSYLQDTNVTEFWNGSAWVAAGTAPGLVHINTTTFTTQSSVSVNNVFTATYDNYLLLIFFTDSPQTGGIIRARVGGTDNTSANYQYQESEVQSTAYTGLRSTGATSMSTGGTGSTAGGHMTIQIFSPFLTQRTGFKTSTYLTISGGYMRDAYGQMTVTTSYDGFTIAPGSGTYSGTLRVYGYKNS